MFVQKDHFGKTRNENLGGHADVGARQVKSRAGVTPQPEAEFCPRVATGVEGVGIVEYFGVAVGTCDREEDLGLGRDGFSFELGSR